MAVPRVIPVVLLGAVAAAAVGAVALVEHLTRPRGMEAAAPGTPQVGSRLPIGLWPSDGTEPMVEHRLRGWRELSAAIYHRDTTLDDAALARAVVIAQVPRREQDARREIALESHVLLDEYDSRLVAAAWLHPLPHGTTLDDLTAFGIGAMALDTLAAAAELASDPDLVRVWGREFGIDVVRPQVTSEMIADTVPERRGYLRALLLGLAAERVAERHLLANPSRG